MKNPKQADRVCDLAYAISMATYLIVAVCGYIMYGRDVSDEVGLHMYRVQYEHGHLHSQISKDLANTPGFSATLNQLAVWSVALVPLTKAPLALRPVRFSCYL
jgi:vesicular inhibitory amino acid transporter